MKKIKYKLMIIIFLVIIGTMSYNMANYINTEKNKAEEGMHITILGGSSMKDKGDTNACGYVLRTKNQKLIIVDGGNPIDADLVYSYIEKYGNGKVDYWFVTHPHMDHIGALINLLNSDKEFEIENLCYNVLSLDYYEAHDKRGFEAEKAFYGILDSKKIKNKIICQKDQVIDIDNVRCDIIRVANPNIETSEGGNESTMVFKFTATDVNKKMLFLGDIYKLSSEELMQRPELLKSDGVQMAHHGQNGASKEVYNAISPEICFFSTPKWLYDNDNGGGYNSGKWKTTVVRGWVKELGAKTVRAFEGDQTYNFTRKGIFKVYE